MAKDIFEDSVRACFDCIEACENCIDYCIGNPAMQECLRLCLACAETCQTCATAMRNSMPSTQAESARCAAICDACAAECKKHDEDVCKDCAAICYRCAHACRQTAVLGWARGNRHGTLDEEL